MKLNKIVKCSYLGVAGSVGVLALLAVAMLCPVQKEGANAATEVDCVTTWNDSCTKASATTPILVNNRSAVAVSLQDEINIEVRPDVAADGTTFAESSTNLTVSTNNSSGYSVYMHTAGDNANLNSESSSSVIAPLAGEATKATFGKNTWGYAISAKGGTTDPETASYKPVNATSSTEVVASGDIPTKQDVYDLSFATAIGTDLPAGQYSNSVVVSVITNPTLITNMTNLIYMQDMSHEICKNTADDYTKQLIDVRDGHKYYVAKLRDGNCWMTQNLSLDLNADRGLSMANTAIPRDWNKTNCTGTDTNPGSSTADGLGPCVPPATTSTTVPAAESSPSQVATKSWNFGTWVLATPTLGISCEDQTDISVCTKVGFIKIDDTWTADAGATKQGTWNFGKYNGNTLATAEAVPGSGNPAQGTLSNGRKTFTGLVTVDVTNKTYDPHYLIGNYYQYNTATAGTGGTLANANAPGSICPKNWQLPLSGNNTGVAALNNDNNNGSFFNMLSAYGLTSTVTSTAGSRNVVQPGDNPGSFPNNGGTKPYSFTAGEFNIAAAPLYFVRSGDVDIHYGRLIYASFGGVYWSRDALAYSSPVGVNTATAYDLYFNASGVNPSNYNNRWYGFPLRCLAL